MRSNPRDHGNAEDGYQGWSNYETWAVQLWLSNEEPSYRHWTKQAKAVAMDHESLRAASRALARQMRSEVEEAVEESKGYKLLPGFARDIMSAALGEVDWDEIAGAWLEGYDFDDSDDENDDGDDADDAPDDDEND